ncbi:hypothetical protein FA15DRAFT_683259 [Coprinopsis marcescibilis]|uniref:Helitron helicase-like domain-containing protein n=1 Tax=Coprinopsis marcescibilis TaxID=230819 RepID=A0A5C3KEY0_COPMA|nr:hypothetical protein FA15DRAFT_683259 [Coprinopsis marcescibilis]
MCSLLSLLGQLFLTHILCWDQPHKGVFSRPKAYYGTVEQQGWMTLHLHILIWIQGSLSPKEIRERLMSDDTYLEGSHIGEFLTGTKDKLRTMIPRETIDKGSSDADWSGAGYINLTLSMPIAPPQISKLYAWHHQFQLTVDDLLLKSNVHSCQDKNGRCSARFPKSIVPYTMVDPMDGHVIMKKLESSINTVTPAVTYTNRCNTDTTSLQLGTGIKATVGYVCDYLTKASLKTHQIFSTIKLGCA